METLRLAGFAAKELRLVAFKLIELKEGGFSATEIKVAGFGCSDMRSVGHGRLEQWSPLQLMGAFKCALVMTFHSILIGHLLMCRWALRRPS